MDGFDSFSCANDVGDMSGEEGKLSYSVGLAAKISESVAAALEWHDNSRCSRFGRPATSIFCFEDDLNAPDFGSPLHFGVSL